MKLYYYSESSGNFGDDLNPWLWQRLLPKPLVSCFDDATLFIGIGSVLNDNIPSTPAKKIVFGTGVGYGTGLPTITPSWTIYCVRGPLSARALGLPVELGILDSGTLVREFYDVPGVKEYPAAFMPHHHTPGRALWRRACESLDILFLDPSDPIESTIDGIRRSRVVIAEAMHGAITAEAFRVPWIPVRTSPRILEFKWRDWSASVDLTHRFEWLPPVSVYRRPIVVQAVETAMLPMARGRMTYLLRHAERRLSDNSAFDERYRRLALRLAELRLAA